MATYTLTANRFAILRYLEQMKNDHTSEVFIPDDYRDQLLLGFSSPPESQKYERIVSFDLYGYTDEYTDLYPSYKVFDENTANYFKDSVSLRNYFGFIGRKYYVEWGHKFIEMSSNIFSDGYTLYHVLKHGSIVACPSKKIYTPASSNKPYIIVTTTGENVHPIVSAGIPTGNVNRKNAINFSWSLYESGYCFGEYSPTAAVFKWRVKGTETWTEIALSDKFSQYVSAPDEFPSGEIEWQADVTFDNGETSSTSINTIDTVEPAPSVETKSPKNTIINRSDVNVLQWNYSISNNAQQYAYEIEQSADGNIWDSLVGKTVSTETEYSVAAESITAGDWYWRIRAYNNDDIASDWDSAHVKVIGAPEAPNIQFTDISPAIAFQWSAGGQQGYEIRIDGKIVKQQYGIETSYKYDGWLQDGNHIVEVRIQNSFGLWSKWGTASALIENVAGNAITLSVLKNVLTWTDAGYSGYAVYRNDKLIARTSATRLVDRFGNGNAIYQVRGYYDNNGNYGLSNAVETIIEYNVLTLYDLENGVVLDLGNATRQTRQTNVTINRDVELVHYSGADYPTAERGTAKEKKYSFEFALPVKDVNRSAVEELSGRMVAVLNQYGETIVGVASSLRYVITEFFYSYSLVVEATEYDEVMLNAQL